MNYQLCLALCLQILLIDGAPMLVMPIPWMAQSAQQIVLQKQLMELQALQQLSAQPAVQISNEPQPLLIILPKEEPFGNIETNELHSDNNQKTIQINHEHEDDDLNSIVIDAASESTEDENQAVLPKHQRAILLIPNARLSIGGIVSAIPWLPIEINVPDTIAWAYNGIASGIGSIISIIGRPFQSSPQAQVQEAGLKSVLQQIQVKHNVFRPIVMIPIDGPVMPIQV